MWVEVELSIFCTLKIHTIIGHTMKKLKSKKCVKNAHDFISHGNFGIWKSLHSIPLQESSQCEDGVF